MFFEFHSSYCLVKSQATKEVLLHGTVGPDGLYRFEGLQLSIDKASKTTHTTTKTEDSASLVPLSHFPSIHNNTAVLNTCNIAEFSNTTDFSSHTLWHNRLGHPSAVIVHKTLDLCNVPYVNKQVLDFCNACCLGKIHRLPATDSTSVYNSPFELVYTDLWGLAPAKSSTGFLYYVTFLDAHTKYTWIYLLHNKSEVLSTFLQFKKLVELQFECKIKAVQSDWGGEYRPFTKALADFGIAHRLICPHTHHQNGSIERKHRHIVELGLTLLAQAHMPTSYWDHAFLIAVHLINRLPTVTLNYEVPFVNFGKFPDYK